MSAALAADTAHAANGAAALAIDSRHRVHAVHECARAGHVPVEG